MLRPLCFFRLMLRWEAEREKHTVGDGGNAWGRGLACAAASQTRLQGPCSPTHRRDNHWDFSSVGPVGPLAP